MKLTIIFKEEAGGIGCSLTIYAPTANGRTVRNVNLHLP